LGADRSADVTPDTSDAIYCARHPQVETVITCGRCGTPICPRCLVQTPVGARCPACANVRKLPTVDVKPIFIVRGLAAAVVTGVLVGLAWGFLLGPIRLGLLFVLFIGLGLGYAVGEAVAVSTNRKRSPVLEGCAVIGVVIAYLVQNVVSGVGVLPQGDIYGYITTGLAAIFAIHRVRG
jgi:hypothetical protein